MFHFHLLHLPLSSIVKENPYTTFGRKSARNLVMKVSPELGGSIIKADTPSIGEVYELFQSYLKKHKIGETKFGWRFKINEIKLDKLWPVWGFTPEDKLAKHLSVLSDSDS